MGKLYQYAYSRFRDDPPRKMVPIEEASAFVEGAKYAAQLTQELGEVLTKYATFMSPGDLKKCEAIFAKNKEIVDEQ